MAESFRILIVEDSNADAELAQYEIRAVLENSQFRLVKDRQEYLETLKTFQPDLIVSDYTLPRFDGLTALQLAQQHSPFTPFIMWSGTISEDTAVQCMKAGANNYVLKDNVKRLGPAARHAIEERGLLIERAQAEEALRRSEERFRTLYERMPLGYQSLDANGCFVDINQAWLDALGYQREEVIGRWFGDFLVSEQKPLFSERFPKFKELGEVHNIEFEMLCKDGSHTFVSFDGRIGYDQHMQFKQTHCILTDITERKRAEEALRTSEAKYRALVENLPDVIMRFDRSCRHLFVSPSVKKVVSLQPEEFIGKTHRELGFDSVQARYWESMILAAFDCELPLRSEFTFENEEGKFVFEWDLIPEYDMQGNVNSILTIARDITARKEVEGQIKQTLAEKEALIKEVHHRVKNNLASIVALIGLQQDTLSDSDAINEMNDLMNRVHSMALVHELLYQSETLSQVDLQDYFTRLVTHLRASYDVEIMLDLRVLAMGAAMTLDYATPCGLIVNELVTNAFKYAFPQGQPRPGQSTCEVTVTAACEGEYYTITVHDNGVGLPADFDLESPSSLGLQLVTMLVRRQLDGQLELDRSDGTTFRLHFAAL